MKSYIVDPGNIKDMTRPIIEEELPMPERVNEVAEATEFLDDALRMEDQPFEYPVSKSI